MNLRAFKAIFLKAFGRNGNGGAKASTTTFVVSIVFVVALTFMIANLFSAPWLSRYYEYEGYHNIIVINAPASFDEFLYSSHPDIGKNLKHRKAEAAYDYSTYNSLMRNEEAFMTIYFPEDFEEKVAKDEKAEVLTYILRDRLKYADWQKVFTQNVMEEYQNYIKIEQDVPVTLEEIYTVGQMSVNTNGKSQLEYTIDYFATVMVPLVTFIVMLYIGMSKGTNAVAGQKEKGTLTGILLTPVRKGTIIMGNLTGIWIATLLPALAGLPFIMILPMFRSLKGFVYSLILMMTLSLLISSITLMISIMNDTVVTAQTAFLPVFFILLGVAIMCIQGVNDIAHFYYWIPVYGHFYGIGTSLIQGDISFIDVLICTLSTILLSGICIAISGGLLKTERFTTTVESYSDRKANKYAREYERALAEKNIDPSRVIYGYEPEKYIKSRKLLAHHTRFPLIVLSIFQILSLIPAAIFLSKTADFKEIVMNLRKIRDLEEILTTTFDTFGLLMAQPIYIFFMGLSYYGLLATYFIKVRFIEKNKLTTLGIPSSFKTGIKDYLKGMLLGITMFGSVYLLLLVSGVAKITSVGIPSGMLALFFLDILMWLPQGASEELMFRGYMMPRLSPRFGKAFAVFFSSLLFGLFHAANKGFTLLALLNLVLIAVAYALICLYKENIMMTCAAHSVWNFAQGNLFGLEVSGNESKATIIHSVYGKDISPLLTGGNFGPEGGLFVTLVSVTVIVITIFLMRRKSKKVV